MRVNTIRSLTAPSRGMCQLWLGPKKLKQDAKMLSSIISSSHNNVAGWNKDIPSSSSLDTDSRNLVLFFSIRKHVNFNTKAPLNRSHPLFHSSTGSSPLQRTMISTAQQTLEAVPSLVSNIVARLLSTATSKVESVAEQSTLEHERKKLLLDSTCNRCVKINACGKLYEELAKTNPTLYSYAPRGDGIDFEVRYYDSAGHTSGGKANGHTKSDAPVVCLLHGAPGQYSDFVGLINHLSARGCRVIAPNFPDYSATLDHCFRHSPRERSDFLLNFFEAIKLDKLDMLIAHSSAVYTMFELLNRTSQAKQLNIKSLGLFSTPSYQLPANLSVTPARLFMLRLFDYPFLRPFLMLTLNAFIRFQGIKNRVDKNKMDDMLMAASAMGYSSPEKMAEHIRLVHEYRVPTYLLVGTNDRLISLDCFNHLKRDLGIESDEQVKLYNMDGSLKRAPVELNNLIEVSQFEGGGHYSYQRYSKQVGEDVYNFLRRKVLDEWKEGQSTLTTKL